MTSVNPVNLSKTCPASSQLFPVFPSSFKQAGTEDLFLLDNRVKTDLDFRNPVNPANPVILSK